MILSSSNKDKVVKFYLQVVGDITLNFSIFDQPPQWVLATTEPIFQMFSFITPPLSSIATPPLSSIAKTKNHSESCILQGQQVDMNCTTTDIEYNYKFPAQVAEITLRVAEVIK